ncbi:conserved unknown protein [Ectocarpus siliculosus]|uniref:Uncharacterized protein n=1 Tax=Ectocarpus siliculosus TaxID=2880 RepID=D7FMP3_ECTSI|nr:conserved unknown protein [Ectocarpus siliculosus]|eukprot:CBJ25940.1 conserved unknown protein [Ectocarpus siliculosus]
MGDMGMGMGPEMGGGGGGEEEDERQFYSSENVAHNTKVLEYCRTSLCAVGGIVSVSLSLMVKMGTTDVSLYTAGKGKLAMFAFGGVGNYALTYILFWTLAYTLVYIY